MTINDKGYFTVLKIEKIADDLNMSLTKRVHQLSGTCKDNNCAHSKN